MLSNSSISETLLGSSKIGRITSSSCKSTSCVKTSDTKMFLTVLPRCFTANTLDFGSGVNTKFPVFVRSTFGFPLYIF